VLRRKFSASQFLPDVRHYGATYANYVGKPLSYVLATPERPDDADNPLRAVYGNEGAPADVERFARRFGTVVQDGFGSTEGGIAIGRTPDTPPGALGPLPAGTDIVLADARTFVHGCAGRFDYIAVDLFRGEQLAARAFGKPFLLRLRTLLERRGQVAINLFADLRMPGRVARIAAVFEIRDQRGVGGNLVVHARRRR
jgi:hypothetical protein